MRWLRYRREMVIDGTNSRMRALLESGRGPSLQSPLGYSLQQNNIVGRRTALPLDRTPPLPSAPTLGPAASLRPQVLYASPQPPEVFPLGYGLPVPATVERWLCDAEGTA